MMNLEEEEDDIEFCRLLTACAHACEYAGGSMGEMECACHVWSAGLMMMLSLSSLSLYESCHPPRYMSTSCELSH